MIIAMNQNLVLAKVLLTKIATDTEPGLELLETWSMDQDQLERNVAREANKAMAERDIELDENG